ncbi:hypothetical protein Y032_0223g2672 [Ancylostoma ceylanicum]|uniref:Uncharacterized protein n=1 Tax=Ancylostoma ceylanicum TaxID=53326 RepID=A0A016SII7_9BILA|nr:hypothetical protein Y032_0223g2672 [Ancylostoma ceylanicum]
MIFSIPVPPVEQRDMRESRWQGTYPWDTVQWTANIEECKKVRYFMDILCREIPHIYCIVSLVMGYMLQQILVNRTFDFVDQNKTQLFQLLFKCYITSFPALYSFFPVSINELRKPKAKMYEAGLVHAVKTKETMEKIVKWSVLCALEEKCMGTQIIPNTCEFNRSDPYSSFARCHRYDQSVVNVLLADAYYYDRRYYTSEITDFFRIQRFISLPVKNRELKCT